VLVFAREIDKDLTGLVKELEKVVAASKKGVGFVVLMDDDKKGAAEKLKKLAEKEKLKKIALTVNSTGKKSPKGHKVNPKVKHTIIVYEKKKVVHNFALNKVGADETKKVVAAAKKVLKAGVSL
jgi:hypothetical protein